MEDNKDIHQVVYRYVMSYDPEGEQIVKNIFMKQLNSQTFSLLREFSDSSQDLFYSFYEKKIISKRDILKDRFEKNPYGIISYIRKMIISFLKDERDKRKSNFSTKLDIDLDNMPVTIDQKIISYIEAKEILENILKFFTEEEQKTLCYLFFKDKFHKKYCLENLSQDAIYKRAERLKKKLKMFVLEYKVTYEGFELFKDKFLMSEICKKICS
ncbi:MAG: sigma-70 family RNA polymerase sigma factor [Aquificae bacterium]|nr:sigma-70 family RNA polymerase sigma factor [Aquificota bacterium]